MTPSTPYYLIELAANLRFNDQNGILVTAMYPVALSQELNTPSTGYISRIGAVLSNTMDHIVDIDNILIDYGQSIGTLNTQVQNILTSGATAIPEISGQCLNGSTVEPIDVVTTELITSYCSYIATLGTTSMLNSGIAALNNPVLNTLPAYSQNSTMSGLLGWISSPTTVGQWMNNIALAYLDMRVGVTQALNQSNVTCGSININVSGVYSSADATITLYFPGSNIPSNFSDNTSHLRVIDSADNEFTMNFNSITAVMTNGYLTIDISASTLLPTSDYTVYLTYDVTSTTPALGCSNTIITTIANTATVCPNVNTWSTATTVSFTFNPPITTNVSYTVDLLDASGTTVLFTKSYTNPSTAITDTFTNLSPATSYNVRVTTAVGSSTTICSLHGITTTS